MSDPENFPEKSSEHTPEEMQINLLEATAEMMLNQASEQMSFYARIIESPTARLDLHRILLAPDTAPVFQLRLRNSQGDTLVHLGFDEERRALLRPELEDVDKASLASGIRNASIGLMDYRSAHPISRSNETALITHLFNYSRFVGGKDGCGDYAEWLDANQGLVDRIREISAGPESIFYRTDDYFPACPTGSTLVGLTRTTYPHSHHEEVRDKDYLDFRVYGPDDETTHRILITQGAQVKTWFGDPQMTEPIEGLPDQALVDDVVSTMFQQID
jgi:hypothetical protein